MALSSNYTIGLIIVGEILCALPGFSQENNIELVIQSSHSRPIEAFAFSHDNRLIASSADSPDNTINIYDQENTQLLRTLNSTSEYGYNILFTKESRRLVVIGGSGMIEVFDIYTGQLDRKVNHGRNILPTIALTPNEDFLITCSEDYTLNFALHNSTVRVLDFNSLKTVNTFKMPGHRIWSVAASTNLIFRVLAYDYQKEKILIRTWELSNGSYFDHEIKVSTKIISGTLSKDASFFALGTYDGNLIIGNAIDGHIAKQYPVSNEPIEIVQFSNSNKLVAAICSGKDPDDKSRIYNVANGEEKISFLAKFFLTNLHSAFSNDDNLFAFDEDVIEISGNDPFKKKFPNRIRMDMKDIQFNRRYNKIFISTGYNSTGRLLALDIPSGTSSKMKILANSQPEFLAMDPEEKFLAAYFTNENGKENTIKLYDLDSTYQGNVFTGTAKNIALSTEARYIVTSLSPFTIWDVDKQDVVFSLPNNDGPESAEFSPDGKTLLLKYGFYVRLVSVATWKKTDKIFGSSSGGITASFSPDSRSIAITSRETGSIDLANLQDKSILTVREKSLCCYEKIAWNRDGNLIALKYRDGTDTNWGIKIFNMASKSVLSEINTGTTDNVDFLFIGDENLLLTATRFGTFKFWDFRSSKLVCTLLILEERTDLYSWLAFTPTGLFDGSIRAFDKFLWRVKGSFPKIFTAESLFRDFFYPGLLSDIIQNKPLPVKSLPETEVADPIVSIILPEGKPTDIMPTSLAKAKEMQQVSSKSIFESSTIDIQIKVEESKTTLDSSGVSGATDIRLFRNGVLAKIWRGPALKNGQRVAMLKTTVPLVEGKNNFVAYAFNRANIKSKNASAQVYKVTSKELKPMAFMVAIGINKYPIDKKDLLYAVADAKLFSSELRNELLHTNTIRDFVIDTLYDENATKEKILTAIKKLKLSPAWIPRPNDIVFIYFSGHGKTENGEFFLVPHDGSISSTATDISTRDIESALEDVDCENIIIVIDACNSGRLLKADDERLGPLNSKGLVQLAYDKGLNILTASQDYQSAIGTSDFENGILTHTLITEGLKNWKADTKPKDNKINIKEWLDFASSRVPEVDREWQTKKAGIGELIRKEYTEERGSRKKSEPTPNQPFYQTPKSFSKAESEQDLVIASKDPLTNENSKELEYPQRTLTGFKKVTYNEKMNVLTSIDLEISELSTGNKFILFKNVQKLHIDKKNGFYSINFAPLNISVRNADYYLLLAYFYSFFVDVYDTLMAKEEKDLKHIDKSHYQYFKENVQYRVNRNK